MPTSSSIIIELQTKIGRDPSERPRASRGSRAKAASRATRRNSCSAAPLRSASKSNDDEFEDD